MLRKSYALRGATLLYLVLSGCGSQDAPASEATVAAPSTDRTARAVAPLTEKELELRRERIREYFRARLSRLDIVATTRTDSGQVIDWVPAPRDVPEMPPPPEEKMPEGTSPLPETPGPEDKDAPVQTELQLQPWAQGPAGTVPVVRFDVENYLRLETEPPENPEDVFERIPEPSPASNDRYYGNWNKTGGPFFGSAAIINLWDTSGPVDNETSIAQVAVMRGNPIQAIEVGKIELESLNGDKAPHLFTYFRTNGSEDGDWEGGYNQLCDGWRQVSTQIVPGAKLIGMSAQGKAQYVMDIEVRLHKGNWWVRVLGEWIGYYPRCKDNDTTSTCKNEGFLFSTQGIRNNADKLTWFGEVYDSSAPEATATQMGSGRFASEGWSHAAYFRNLTYFWAPTTYWWWDASTKPVATDAKCYSVSEPTFSSTSSTKNRFFFGGPGKAAEGCH
ncbi:neprosin family prolyl endopeptidase [Pyxidicoccus caerfyrddinensis]|uniref:neprosin family prolyl endopeptidase n=1 Tax=Pyxidicoccus caerfyrddinensis TaxID=2709663 RepID=UPI0013DB1B3D|nr:neprosin family prolyl endopeptidase [Pyxidicoccus caerfyrddinensis]